MRVLRFSHSGVVAAWRQRERELRKRAVEVTLVCANAWDEGGSRVVFDASGDDFAFGAKTYGRHPNLFIYSPLSVWRAFARAPYDLLDIHEEPFSFATAEVLLVRALRRSKVPFVFYSAQNLDKHYPAPFSWIERWVLAHAAGAHVCNRAAGERLRRHGLRGELVVLPLGVDVELFQAAQRDVPQKALHVGYVGRLAHHKGVHVLLEAIAGLECCTLEFVGGGEESGELARQATALEVTNRVTIRGPASQDALADIYRSFDVVVVPSIPTRRWDEQFCRVAVEAMASGVPVVVSDTGALPEVVGDAGVLVRPGNPIDLRTALDLLSADDVRWSKLREAGLERAGHYAWAIVAEQQVAFYRRCCG